MALPVLARVAPFVFCDLAAVRSQSPQAIALISFRGLLLSFLNF